MAIDDLQFAMNCQELLSAAQGILTKDVHSPVHGGVRIAMVSAIPNGSEFICGSEMACRMPTGERLYVPFVQVVGMCEYDGSGAYTLRKFVQECFIKPGGDL